MVFKIRAVGTFYAIPMGTKSSREKINHTQQLRNGIWLLRNWYIVLPEDGTQVPKHAGETHLKYVRIINSAFRWYNLKKKAYAEIKNARNGKMKNNYLRISLEVAIMNRNIMLHIFQPASYLRENPHLRT
jgi:hypothetical protein